MVPYTFTLSSQLIITFIFSSSIFLGIKIIAARRHNLKLFSIFFPSGLSIYLGLILIPIEFISFFFKPISLSTRLFANMVAGHTLLKVIAGFILILANQIGILYFSQFILIFIIFIVMFLELMVGVIQACVFSILCCIYINEILQLH